MGMTGWVPLPLARRDAVRRPATLLAAAFAIAVLLAAVPTAASAHSQLVSSSPGAGEVIATPPTEVRLSFTEPVDPRYTSLDLLDSAGAIIVAQAGTPDPANARVLVASVPAGAVPADGLVTVNWRTLSAADGHVAQGFLTFGVGKVTEADFAAAGGAGGATGAAAAETGQLHGGHSAAIAIVEVPARMLGYGGAMLAVGLAIFGYVVLRPAARALSSHHTKEADAIRPAPEDARDASGAPGSASANGPIVRRTGARARGGRRGGTTKPRAVAGRAIPFDVRMATATRRARVAQPAPWSMAEVEEALAVAAGVALIATAAGWVVLLAIGVASLAGSAGTPDVVAFATGTRSGGLLAGGIVLGAVGGIAVLAVFRLGGRLRARAALTLGGATGLGCLVLAAAGSHAAAFASPVPGAVDVVHLASAGVWLAGLGVLAAAAGFSRAGRLDPDVMRSLVPRFSALALVSVATIALTGVYADQLLTGDLLSTGSPYELNLVLKIVVFLLALVFGAVNFFDSGHDRPWIGGLRRRLTLELAAGIAVLAIAANLTSGSPTASARPVAIEPAVSSVTSGAPVSLELLPGRPGPNRFIARVAGTQPAAAVTELVLQRLDAEVGTARMAMRPDPGGQTDQLVSDASLPVGSRWDATIVLSGPEGELARQRFVFGVDAEAISEGRATTFLDPALVVAILLLALGILGLGFGIAGGVLPRTLPDASRPALLGAGALSAILGLTILLAGIPH
jgi:putative copper export protein/methionine-rich copper-binding protein CopC